VAIAGLAQQNCFLLLKTLFAKLNRQSSNKRLTINLSKLPIFFSTPRYTMAARYVLSEYVNFAMAQAEYDKLDDGTFAARIPACTGVLAFASSLQECENELRSTLEEWILLGLKLGHPLPILGDIDLSKEPTREPVDAL
jgi:predicted RNase H-like HicB family nuclease